MLINKVFQNPVSIYDGKILMPVGQLNGETLLSASLGHNPLYGHRPFFPLQGALCPPKDAP